MDGQVNTKSLKKTKQTSKTIIKTNNHGDCVLHNERQIKFSSTDIIQIVLLLQKVEGDERVGDCSMLCFTGTTVDCRTHQRPAGTHTRCYFSQKTRFFHFMMTLLGHFIYCFNARELNSNATGFWLCFSLKS